MLRERRHGQRSDELLGQRSHYDFHLGACAFEQAAEYGRFVGGDAACDAEQDMSSFETHTAMFRLAVCSPL